MLTNSQERAFSFAKRWLESKGRLLKIGGPAGSGKSYLIPLIADLVGLENCLLITPTGKAATNLQKNGLQASTIHSVIYKVKVEDEDEDDLTDSDTRETDKVYAYSDPLFLLKDKDTYSNKRLIIIDEGSMVGANLLKDILYFNVPVLIVGDPHQLAPVRDKTVFNSCDIYLEEIVRQAKDSPIIWLSRQVLDGKVPTGVFGSSMIRTGQPTESELMYADQVLTDTNRRRGELNTLMRNLTFGEDVCANPRRWVLLKDRIVCRTNYPAYTSTSGFILTNGTQGVVEEILHRGIYGAEFVMTNKDLGSFKVKGTNQPLKFPAKTRPPTMEYGYALTVHLSQGSEWDNVIYDLSDRPQKRALYTGITRAKNSLLVTL